MRRRVLALTIVLSSWLAGSADAAAQFKLPGLELPKPAQAAPTASKSAPESGAPIPAVAIADRAREAETALREARQLRYASDIERISDELPRFSEEITELSRASSNEIPGSRQRGLRDLALRLDDLRIRFEGWQLQLKQRTGAIEAQHRTIAGLQKTWTATSAALQSDPEAPRAALTKVAQELRELDEASDQLNASAERLLELEERLGRTADALEANLARVRRAEDRAENDVVRRTGMPIWELGRAALPALRAHPEYMAAGFQVFWRHYAVRLPLDVSLLAASLAVAVLLAQRARRRARLSGQAVSEILDAPLSAAALVALVVARLYYNRSVYAVLDVLGVASLLPLLRLVPRLLRQTALLSPFAALVSVLALHRGLMLAHLVRPWHQLSMLLVGALLWAGTYWTWRVRRQRPLEPNPTRLDRVIPLFVRATLIGLGVATFAGLLGYETLLELLIDGFTGSVYWLLLSVALTRVLHAFIEAGLDAGRVRALASMRNHGDLIRARALGAARWAGIAVWTGATLQSFGLITPARELLAGVLDTTAHAGSWSLSLGDLVRFALTMYLATKAAGLVSFVLDEDVLPNMNLARGVPAAISSLSRYALVGLGFLLAVGAAGVDMGHVTLLASALSVGIGFGLQNVVNNFVSGLMLVFERPIRVGDMVQLGDLVGEVRKIGIRASTLRTGQGAEVILPNAELISNRVTNWTLSDFGRRVEIPIGVAYGSDPQRVVEIIQDAVSDIKEIERFPKPACIFVRLGESSLDFELRIWVQRSDDWPNVRSAALMAIHQKLTDAGIEIPFPQRDLHVRSIDGAALRQLPQPVTPTQPDHPEQRTRPRPA